MRVGCSLWMCRIPQHPPASCRASAARQHNRPLPVFLFASFFFVFALFLFSFHQSDGRRDSFDSLSEWCSRCSASATSLTLRNASPGRYWFKKKRKEKRKSIWSIERKTTLFDTCGWCSRCSASVASLASQGNRPSVTLGCGDSRKKKERRIPTVRISSIPSIRSGNLCNPHGDDSSGWSPNVTHFLGVGG